MAPMARYNFSNTKTRLTTQNHQQNLTAVRNKDKTLTAHEQLLTRFSDELAAVARQLQGFIVVLDISTHKAWQ